MDDKISTVDDKISTVDDKISTVDDTRSAYVVDDNRSYTDRHQINKQLLTPDKLTPNSAH